MKEELTGYQKDIITWLYQMSKLLQLTVTKESLVLFAKMLDEYEPKRVEWAIFDYAKNASFPRFPLPSELLNRITPVKLVADESNEIVAAIFSAIRSYGGRYNINAARENLGEIAWRVVENFGGWERICTCEEGDANTMRAQLRNHAQAVLNGTALDRKYLEVGCSPIKRKIEFKTIGELIE